MTAFLTGRIYIHPQNASLWKELDQLIISFLRPSPIIADAAAGTVRTTLRNILSKTTVVAVHGLSVHMQGQRNITVGTAVNGPTFPTHNKAGIPPPVEHENRLFSLIQTILNSL